MRLGRAAQPCYSRYQARPAHPMRRAAKVDACHGEVVAALRKAGAHVTDLSAVGDGVADILVSYRGRWFPIELKDGTLPPSKRLLTPAQKRWHREILATAYVANSVTEALFIIGVSA